MRKLIVAQAAALLTLAAAALAQQGTGGPVPGGPSGVEAGEGSTAQGVTAEPQRYQIGSSTETAPAPMRRARGSRQGAYDRRHVPQPGVAPPEERPR